MSLLLGIVLIPLLILLGAPIWWSSNRGWPKERKQEGERSKPGP